ncbi:gfo/Idh/MocA family oxidoreductase [halophilic archaeon]|nr:gfo/Idh/MocA family oxidoreductase [halophilic archaeon]
MDVRIGAIGLGGLGRIELGILDDVDGVRVVAGVDVSPEARESFESEYDAPAYADHEALLAEQADELDAVTIVTPHTLHHEQAVACLAAGVDVFVEKPMVTDVDDAVDLVETADEHDGVLQVGYQRHFHPLFGELRRVVDEGRIGDVHMVNCYLGQDWIDVQRGTWRTNPDLSGGGQLYDSGSHLLDAVLWTTRTEPVSVAAVTDDRGEDVDVNSALAATLDRDGSRVTASVGVSADGDTASPEEGMVVWGTDGHVEYDGDRLRIVDADGEESTVRPAEGSTAFEPLTRKKLTNFVRSVAGEEEPAVPGETGVRVTAMTEAAYEAAETGRTVDVQALLDDATEEQLAASA